MNKKYLTKTSFEKEEQLLPKPIFTKAVRSGKEFGWRKEDFVEAILAAKFVGLGIVGGQVQFILPDGIGELHWLDYFSDWKKRPNENWTEYCERTAKEVIAKFQKLCETTDFVQEAIQNNDFLAKRHKENVDLQKYLTFIVYFKEEKEFT